MSIAGQPCLHMTCLINISPTVNPLTTDRAWASMYREKLSTMMSTHLFPSSLGGNWRTSVDTTSHGLVGLGRAKYGVLILR